MTANRNIVIILLSFPLLAGVMLTSLVGLTAPGFYSRETANWQAQSVGQDIINLFLIAPVLLTSALLAYNGRKTGLLIWGGVNLYLIYTFCLYCFDVHFNSLFAFYCLNLGLSFYSFLHFIYLQLNDSIFSSLTDHLIHSVIGYYFILVSLVFYSLWLSEVIPAMMYGTIPPSLKAAGLPTNGVHVIDLSVLLPGLFIVGIMLLRKRKFGYILSQVCLVFIILMNFTIAGLMIVMKQSGLEFNLVVAGAMILLAIFSILLFVWQLKAITHSSLSTSA